MKQENKVNSNETQKIFFLVSTRLRLLHLNAFRAATALVVVSCACVGDRACRPLCGLMFLDGALALGGEGTTAKFRSRDDVP